MSEQPITWLTQEAHDRLVAELADREGPTREQIKNRIAAARDEGDLKENGGYHAAREEQGKNEARVRQLKHLLDAARVGRPEADPDEVAALRVVTIRIRQWDEEETFLLGSREENPPDGMEVYSPTSPLGAAVNGTRVGDSATYILANGKEMTVEVLKVETYGG